MYTGAALGFGLIRACRSGLVLYCSVLSDAGGENDGSSAIFERSLAFDGTLAVMSSLCLFVAVSLNNLLNKQSRDQ